MKRSTNLILGVPVDSFTMEETLQYIFHLVDTYASDHRPKLVATVNTDSIAGTMSFRLTEPRHPELLQVLRGADLVTAGDMPVVWLSRHLGPALKERVAAADLVPGLAREAALRGKSLYLLGGARDGAERAAAVLRKECLGLRIAGFGSPMVHVEGPNLVDALKRDGEAVEAVNASSPDVLLVAFGSPKQELFFERNRHRLKVPVTIGIGNTFDSVTGGMTRAPGWTRSSGLERLLHLAQGPRRLWKRSPLDLVKLGSQAWPSVALYQYARKVAPHDYLKRCRNKVTYKYMARGREQVLLMTLPGIVDAGAVPRLASLIPKRPSAHLVLDVSDVGFIDSAGLGLFLNVLNLWGRSRHEVLVIGVTPYARKVITRNRLSDLFAGRLHDTLDDALDRLDARAGKDEWSVEAHEDGPSTRLAFSGRLTPQGVSDAEIRAIASRAGGARCTLDLSGLSAISTPGIILLLKLRKALESLGRECSSSGAHGDVARMLKVTGTMKLI
ncbi:MAG TPA: WecB/TagA/CpsF family glycosyltransferase [Deltaproteobacteria bacterium]|jgi:exopolysaccharide biosynthesis WecB/TagA/CpsF family protein/anti-anti-sigma factor|nr:WecB/TagA/CpsF family glycosyltransferase [Deltaproteobacteria bacterium]HOI07720.1 WecB/TagA/CpsF family glycosyltransferase [Deltaproteobacteria bacterium]